MLKSLYIENIAIIEKASIDFDRGFSVLSGETGAGKSIIIDAINGIMGGRTSRELIRTGTKKASVSALFDIDDGRISKVLEQMGLLTEMDMAAFAGYCQAYARWKEAEEFLTQHGSMVRTPNGYLQQVPQVSIAQTNMKIMLKFCEQFGLTPSARSRIVGGENSDEEDEMEKLLEGGGC